MTSALFQPIAIGLVELSNRIVVSPMCQYSAEDGAATDWHLQHLMNLAMSGAGLVMVEATAVTRAARITHGDLGLYSDANEYALARVLAAARSVALPGTRFGIQIAHAGRKASVHLPWQGGKPLGANDDPWQTLAPSAIPFGPEWHVPRALDEEGIRRTVQQFVDAALRAVRVGFDVVELHMAHGYLLHEFQSPLSNQREDAYGGSPERRMQLLFQIAEAVKQAVPAGTAVGARITGTEWVGGGLQVEDAVTLARGLRDRGIAYACVTSGGNVPNAPIPNEPGYQIGLARRVKQDSGIATRGVGLITTPEQAEDIIASGSADTVALARGFLDDPRWGWRAAERLGAELARPPQYARVAPSVWPPARRRRQQAAE